MMDEIPEWFDRLHGGGAPRGSGVRRDDKPATKILITGEVVGASEKAFKFYNGSETVWLPRSQVDEVEGGLMVAEWLAKKNGLI